MVPVEVSQLLALKIRGFHLDHLCRAGLAGDLNDL
jgi:hypothetical protein